MDLGEIVRNHDACKRLHENIKKDNAGHNVQGNIDTITKNLSEVEKLWSDMKKLWITKKTTTVLFSKLNNEKQGNRKLKEFSSTIEHRVNISAIGT